jgi:hypothetical protein
VAVVSSQIREISSFLADGWNLRCLAMREESSTGVDDVTFLVERYWPGVDEALLRAALPRLEAAARAMTSEGRHVDHLGSLLVPADQVVFSVIRASSEAIAREVNDRAQLRVDRIAAVTSVGFDLQGSARKESDR